RSVGALPAAGDGDAGGEWLPARQVGQVGDADAAYLVPPEVDLLVAVEGDAAPDPVFGFVPPGLDEDAEHGERGTPDAAFAFDEFDVVLLLGGAFADFGDGEGAGSAEEVVGVPLVGAWFGGDLHSWISSSSSWPSCWMNHQLGTAAVRVSVP